MDTLIPPSHNPTDKSGIINCFKPRNMTSRQLVNFLVRLTKIKKIGHSGTLDPIASGVLVICIGKATKLVPFIMNLPKTYITTIGLGFQTDTLDLEGKIILEKEIPPLKQDEILSVLNSFTGTILQTPPQYSALKINGKPGYYYARKGIPITLSPRKVHISEIKLLEFSQNELKLMVKCHKGTYIRSLARDIAVSLGTCGTLTELVRTEIGPFALEDAIPLQKIEEEIKRGFLPLISPQFLIKYINQKPEAIL